MSCVYSETHTWTSPPGWHLRETYLLADLDVILPRTGSPVVVKVLLEPDLQIESSHPVASRLQELQCQAGVYPSTEQQSYVEGRFSWLTPARELLSFLEDGKLRRFTTQGLV